MPARRARRENGPAGPQDGGEGGRLGLPARGQAEAIQKGLQALQQYIQREGRLPRRAAVERLPHGAEHRTGIWYANQEARRDRLGRAQLAALGVDWARP
ncbi:hypothetical protein PV721_01205 [Streptomyces sp. MB09-01]|uniref:hypothetical protein n=1 Tax=Streptomyces sp. MB09-01 TaxID=3028666 RepID=UPI0029A1FE22|nr:hypothetical protein [Streptomyces sp. MB09-01]MDX3533011.1 hypothetical protein [Streptomyces sp. MB09-01]